MQLAITALGTKTSLYLSEILATISSCKCQVVELRCTQMADASAAYVLIEGNWNHVAKLENVFESLQTKLGIHIHSIRPESDKASIEYLPYSLETMSLYRNDTIQDIIAFLSNRNIHIEEISATRYIAHYSKSAVFSTRFIVSVPPEMRLLALREEFLDFCDNLNLDAILEPVKRL